VTAEGEVPAQGSFRDTLLDTLAVLRPSRAVTLDTGVSALGTAGGQVIAILGDVPPAQAGDLAAARRGAAPGVALLLVEDVHAASVTRSVQVLAGSGWRVAVVSDAARLPVAWQEVNRASGRQSAGSVGRSWTTGAGGGNGSTGSNGTAEPDGPAREAAHG
jgi:hypothetical protein